MSLDIDELKKKIIYRSNYRGTKEMDVLMRSFVKSIVELLDRKGLIKLNNLVNLDDEKLYKIKNSINDNQILNDDDLIIKFKKFKI
jgi:antitoxin CptB